MANLDTIPAVFKGLKPLIIGLIRDVLAELGTSASGSGGLTTHDLSGSAHSGTLGIAYVPDALDRNGSRTLVGDLTVATGKTIDGVDISDLGDAFDLLEALFAAHDAATATAAHGTVGAHDHTTTANGGDLTQYPGAEGSGITRRAYEAGRLNKSTTAGPGLLGGGSHIVDVGLTVGQGYGVLVGADDVGVDNSWEFEWFANHIFNVGLTVYESGGGETAAFFLPMTTNELKANNGSQFDVGEVDKKYRTAYFEELRAFIFAEFEMMAAGGFIVVAKDQGNLNAPVLSAHTTVDFGKAMTVGDYVDLRTAGNYERMLIVSLSAGTTYNVTRNTDGSGLNDWNMGDVWVAFGQSANGNGWVQINGYDSPRIQVYKKAATAMGDKELIRLGDLNGNWGYVASKFGLAIGEYLATKANILLDEDGVLRIRNFSTTVVSLGADGLFELVGTMKVSGSITAASSAVVINTTGIQVDKSAGASAATINSYKFMSSGAEWGGVYAYSETLELSQKSITGQSGVIRIRQQSPTGQLSTIILENIINGVVTSRINMGRATGTLDAITMEADVINFQEALQQYGGTSFPASPSNGDKYYRTDRNLQYVYQASTTEWLTSEIFTASLIDVSNLPPYVAATFATEKPTFVYEIPTHTYAARVVSTKFLVLTGATNDGTRYWTYRVRHQNNSGGSFTDLIALANTSAVAANTRVSVATTAASIPQAADGSIVALWLQAVGTTPSNMTFRGTIQYRFVG